LNAAPLKSAYDVVIIGAGVAGLTAAALLTKAGLSICVLEKEPHPGGYLAGFRRKDFRFDTALHWLNQYGSEGTITHLFRFLGDDFPKARPQIHIRRYLGDGFNYLLTNRPDELMHTWQAEFPADAAGIARFFKAAKRLAKAFKAYGYVFRASETMGFWEALNQKKKLLKFALPFIPLIPYSGAKGLHKGLSKYFKSPKLHQVFAADTELLSCLIPIAWAYNDDFQSPPLGGGQRIPEWLEHVILSQDGSLAYQCTVEEILLKKGSTAGIRFMQQGVECIIRTTQVIAACDVELLYERLLPKNAIPEKLKNRLRNADLYSSSVTVSIALDCSPARLGFGEELIHIAGSAAQAHIGVSSDPTSSEISVLAPSVRDPSLAPEDQGTLTLYMPAEMNVSDNWETGQDPIHQTRRNTAYIDLKTRVAETLIDRVSACIAPELRQHILFYEVATPVTHWRYTGNKGGTMMGAKPGRANMQNAVARYRTPVKGLTLGGHWAELGGGVPIAVKAGANAALILLQHLKPEAAKALAAYLDYRFDVNKTMQAAPWKEPENNWEPKPTPAEKKKQAK